MHARGAHSRSKWWNVAKMRPHVATETSAAYHAMTERQGMRPSISHLQCPSMAVRVTLNPHQVRRLLSRACSPSIIRSRAFLVGTRPSLPGAKKIRAFSAVCGRFSRVPRKSQRAQCRFFSPTRTSTPEYWCTHAWCWMGAISQPVKKPIIGTDSRY